jgi:hypothetical protein
LWLFFRGCYLEDALWRLFGGGVGGVCLSLRRGREGGRGNAIDGRVVLCVDENTGLK